MNEKDEIIHNLKKALEIAKKKGNALFIENIARDIKALEAGEESPIIKELSVRIKVENVGVNFADTLVIKGRYQERPRPPFSPGLELSGTVIEVGKKVKTLKKLNLKNGDFRICVELPIKAKFLNYNQQK